MATFTSLASYLASCFDLPLCSLSADQQERVNREFVPLTWAELRPDQRRDFAEDWDRRNRPMTPGATKILGKHLNDLAAAERERDFWRTRLGITASDAAIKQSTLKNIHKELDALNAHHEALRGDAHVHGAAHAPSPIATQADH